MRPPHGLDKNGIPSRFPKRPKTLPKVWVPNTEPVPLDIRQKVLAAEYCAYCFALVPSEKRTVDHRIPRSSGGSNEEGNLVMACFTCNQGKADRRESEWIKEIRNKRARNKKAMKARVAP